MSPSARPPEGAPIFLCDGVPVDELRFAARAIDPARSVAVDACAGSGKTTLLVRRIVRCLLDGAPPDSILAITFTRAAAQEMQVRVRRLLRQLAFAPADQALAILRDDLALGHAAAARLDDARGLYERILTDRRGLDVTTFHRWFWQLARRGQRLGGTEPVLELAERETELLDEAWLLWLDRLGDEERALLAAAFDRAVRGLGAFNVQSLIRSFVGQRTEWIASLAGSGGDAAGRAGSAGAADFADEPAALGLALAAHAAQRRLWADAVRAEVPALRALPDAVIDAEAVPRLLDASGIAGELRRLAALLGLASTSVETGFAASFAAALAGAAGLGGDADDWHGWWQRLRETIATKGGEPRKVRWRSASARAPGGAAAEFAAAVAAAGGADALQAGWEALHARVARLAGLVADRAVTLPLNRDLMQCAVSFACAYQAHKRARGVLDFVDLEAIAARLLRDASLAAYLQSRLDRRYRHLLFDEFQDTSSLQWSVIRDWLAGYAGAGVQPSVFVVGDPKQAIYRFRRAESRVFGAACELLRQAFGATLLTTATTRRNASGITAALNDCLDGSMPHFRRQATLARCAGPALAWRLPIETRSVHPTADAFDWLQSLRGDEENRHRDEGLAIGAAIEAARRALAADGGEPVPYREVIVLARGRTGFAEYERALRSIGIPVVSDRKGGLLDALEATDLIALLRVARDPENDLALAQVLRSPLLGLPAAAIGALALARAPAGEGRRRETLLARLARAARAAARAAVAAGAAGPADALAGDALAGDVIDSNVIDSNVIGSDAIDSDAIDSDAIDSDALDGAALIHADARLRSWIDRAHRLPVHDFLDSVVAEVDADAGYARSVDPAERQIVAANLQALIGLALDHDAGRYPGLPSFLQHVGALDRLDDRDAPDEGRPIEHDAVRLMTVHGAKGLEADLIVIADTAAVRRGSNARFAIDWPPDLERPRETWFRLDRDHAGFLSQRVDARDEELAAVEEWNLLYVAATRARRGLIVSAAPVRTTASAQSWYPRFERLPEPPGDWFAPALAVAEAADADAVATANAENAGAAATANAADAAGRASAATAGERGLGGLRGLRLAALPVGERVAPAAGAGPGIAGTVAPDRVTDPDSGGDADDSLRLAAGTALHRALELTARGIAPERIAAAIAAAGLPAPLAARALALAARVRGLPALAGAFDPACGRDEFELFDAAGQLQRLDRLARVGDALWIIDYKWSVTPRWRAGYIAQLDGYRAAVAALPRLPAWAAGARPATAIRTVLVDASAGRVEFDPLLQ
ncbi:MAG: UvrD-helicase domain-containing protein [Lautropia sp.]